MACAACKFLEGRVQGGIKSLSRCCWFHCLTINERDASMRMKPSVVFWVILLEQYIKQTCSSLITRLFIVKSDHEYLTTADSIPVKLAVLHLICNLEGIKYLHYLHLVSALLSVVICWKWHWLCTTILQLRKWCWAGDRRMWRNECRVLIF